MSESRNCGWMNERVSGSVSRAREGAGYPAEGP